MSEEEQTPPPYGRQHIYFPEKLWKEVQDFALEIDVSASWIVRQAVKRFLEEKRGG